MGTNYTQISCEDRAMIQWGLGQGWTQRAIARCVDRSPSTVSRELRRNGWRNPADKSPPIGRPRKVSGYHAVTAQQRANKLAVKARRRRFRPGAPLWDTVTRLLRTKHSPEQICGILRRMHPYARALHLSHETIYTALYALPRGTLRSELVASLRQSRKRRRPRARGEDRRGRIVNMTSIHVRPPEIDERVIPGHWEGDFIMGARNGSAVGTLVERTTLFVVLARIECTGTQAAIDGFSGVLNRVDAQRRLSLTYDQGKEMSDHAQLTERTGVTVYFADPHSPWQRGINENTNGLLRQYLPKGTDLSGFSQDDLDAIAWQLNTRPRKTLDWRCPAERFTPDDFDLKTHYASIVALRP